MLAVANARGEAILKSAFNFVPRRKGVMGNLARSLDVVDQWQDFF